MGMPFFVSMGIFPKLSGLLISEFIVVRYIVLSSRRLPDGDSTLNFDNASTTSSGVRLKLRNLLVSTLKMIDVAFESNGGVAERRGVVEKIGRMWRATKTRMARKHSHVIHMHSTA